MGHSDLEEMGAEAKFRSELGGVAAMACSRAPGRREGARRGRNETGVRLRSDRDGLSGGVMLDKATHVALTPRATTARRRRSTACRAEGRRGRVASAEGARDAGVGAKPGAGEAVLAGARHVAGQWWRRRRTPSRRETEREERRRW